MKYNRFIPDSFHTRLLPYQTPSIPDSFHSRLLPYQTPSIPDSFHSGLQSVQNMACCHKLLTHI